uniref:Uncharacterized protein n=1 Tax=Romanomermis culicivorax TaxID=13658 RepID=A0A915L0C1_ROMCU
MLFDHQVKLQPSIKLRNVWKIFRVKAERKLEKKKKEAGVTGGSLPPADLTDKEKIINIFGDNNPVFFGDPGGFDSLIPPNTAEQITIDVLKVELSENLAAKEKYDVEVELIKDLRAAAQAKSTYYGFLSTKIQLQIALLANNSKVRIVNSDSKIGENV